MKNFFSSMLGSLAALFIFSGLTIFTIIVFVIAAAASADKAKIGNTTNVKDQTILELRLQGDIVERLTEEDLMFANFTIPGQEDIVNIQGLNTILASIEHAKTDDNIEGIYIYSDVFNAGFASSKEIRDALIEFKESGKFIVSYADNYTQQGYYISSAANKVYMNPMGMLDLRGLSMQQIFFKNTLNKIGIEMTIVKHGKYKSAVEPFISDKMSAESKEQSTLIMNTIWDLYCKEVATSRDLNKDMLNLYADKMMALQEPELTINYKLVDKLLYYDEISAELKELSGRDDKKLRKVLINKYASSINREQGAKNKVAIIYASGAIDMGDGPDNINSKKLANDIAKARKDSSIQAIVLRINSPGGSAYGSEQIWREVMLAREGKPFIVSMGDVAASGGYYIACAAHSIVAQPNTITGSIGIYGMVPNVEKMNDKLGLSFDGVKTNKMADFLNPTKAVIAEEKGLLQAYIERGYDTFITRCADGRNMSKGQIDDVGQGRVWTGLAAKENGLVDKLGNIDDAIALAVEMSGLEDYEVVELPMPKPFYEILMENIQGEIKTGIMKVKFGEAYKAFEYAEQIKNMQGIQARMPYDLEIY